MALTVAGRLIAVGRNYEHERSAQELLEKTLEELVVVQLAGFSAVLGLSRELQHVADRDVEFPHREDEGVERLDVHDGGPQRGQGVQQVEQALELFVTRLRDEVEARGWLSEEHSHDACCILLKLLPLLRIEHNRALLGVSSWSS